LETFGFYEDLKEKLGNCDTCKFFKRNDKYPHTGKCKFIEGKIFGCLHLCKIEKFEHLKSKKGVKEVAEDLGNFIFSENQGKVTEEQLEDYFKKE